MHCGRWTVTESHDVKGMTEISTDVIHWEPSKNGEIPSGAIPGGLSENNELLYIGRARLRENRNELTPGMVVPSERRLLLSYGTGVRMTSSYEVLVSAMPDAVSWVRCKGGNVPPNSVIGGIDCSYLEPIYVGRTLGSLNEGKTWRGQRLIDVAAESKNLTTDGRIVQLPGKVHRTHRCLYIPYAGKEFLFRDYEVLVMRQSPASLLTLCRVVVRKTLAAKRENHVTDSVEPGSELDDVNKSINLLALPQKLKEFCKVTYSDL